MKIEIEMENKTKENASIEGANDCYFLFFSARLFLGKRCASYTDDWWPDWLVINEGANTCNRLMPPLRSFPLA